MIRGTLSSSGEKWWYLERKRAYWREVMNLGMCSEGNMNVTYSWVGCGVWVKNMGQEWLRVLGLANWMKGWWSIGSTVSWFLIWIPKQIVYSTISYWISVVCRHSAGLWVWWNYSNSVPAPEIFRVDHGRQIIQCMHISHTSLSWTQFNRGTPVTISTSSRNHGTTSNLSHPILLHPLAIWNIITSFNFPYRYKSGILLFSDHANGIQLSV